LDPLIGFGEDLKELLEVVVHAVFKSAHPALHGGHVRTSAVMATAEALAALMNPLRKSGFIAAQASAYSV
jgi:hypothetical protein